MIYVNGADGMIGRKLCHYMKDAIHFNTNDDLAIILKDATTIIHLDAYGANDNSDKHVNSITSLTNVISHMPNYCKLIYISTCTLYKSSRHISDEQSELDPSTLYLQSKLFCENLIKSHVHNYTILRLSNVVSNSMIHGVIYDWKTQYKPDDNINIYGSYPGSIRSYVSVDNVCKAIMCCVDTRTANNEIINVCSVDAISLTELAEIMKLNVMSYNRRSQDTYIHPSNNKMMDIFKFWTPQSQFVIYDYLYETGYYDKS